MKQVFALVIFASALVGLSAHASPIEKEQGDTTPAYAIVDWPTPSNPHFIRLGSDHCQSRMASMGAMDLGNPADDHPDRRQARLCAITTVMKLFHAPKNKS